ncbi:beta-defensin 4-like [Rattus rattus]|uniref:beta-defensin 4-like n=1 Tax=Rattus rattus TaxID=10117 RepID=UPI0013F38A76|nr:beta-defensin 4-like [Rattus rattus]
MRIHYLLLSFLLVLLSPLSVFTRRINNPFTCAHNGGICWGPCTGSFRQIGTCGLPRIRCCRQK